MFRRFCGIMGSVFHAGAGARSIRRGFFMERTVRNGSHLALLGAALAVLALATGIVCAVTMQRGEAVSDEESQRYLSELTQQASSKVNQRVSFNLELLGLLSDELAINEGEADDCSTAVASFVENGPFAWIGTVDAKGMLAVEGREPTSVAGFSVVERALAGENGVSETLVSVFDGEKGALYAVPASGGDPAVAAVVGWVPPDRMRLLMNTDISGGVGFSHVVASNGDFILRSSNGNAYLTGDNAIQSLAMQAQFEEGDLANLQQGMAAGESGHVRFVVNGEAREMNYVPLERGDWYLLSIVPPDAYSSSLADYAAFSTGATAAIALLAFAAFGGVLLWVTGKKNREILRIAYEDPVTGGFTAVRFDQEVGSKIAEGKPFSFVTVDVKNFKLINDFFGKEQGDRILKHIHDTILSLLSEGEYAARISSDVFDVILDETDPGRVTAWLERLAERANGFNREGKSAYLLMLNCGSYVVEGDEDVVTVRDRANTARKGVGDVSERLFRCSFYSNPEHERLLREKEMENAMEDALENGEFVVYLQPKVSLETGETVGAEALVRWDSEDRGLIPPDEFIPFFERNGFVIKLDLNVFEQVCRLMRTWMDAGLEPLPVSVNLSPLHLQMPDFLDAFEEVRARYDVPPELLELELTERVAFENLELLRRVVDDIHERGFLCSMDDFGSGYSSLNVLKDIPMDILKIDRAFFSSDDERAYDVVSSVVELAKKLNMGTVAEGVETIPQVDILRSIRCDAVQGYVFSAPVPIESFERMVFGEGGASGSTSR